MNILIFCSNPVNGGTARMFYELVTSMRKMLGAGHKVMACINQGNSVEIYKEIEDIIELPIFSEVDICKEFYGGKIVERILHIFQRRIKFFPIKKLNIKSMEKFITENNINAVIIHNGGYVGDDLCNQLLTSAYHCRKNVFHRIYILHSDMAKNLFSKIRYFIYDQKISKEATSIVTVSNYTKNRIEKSSFIKKKIQVISNGISDNRYMNKVDKEKIIKIDTTKFNVLMIGNFIENKGHHKFIQVSKKLVKLSGNYSFTIIGNIYNETYYKYCKNLIKMWHLEEYFSIYHNINNASEYIDLFNVLVVPSLYDESFGLISIEAMAAGRPIVAFACGGIPEVVKNGRNGFIVPIGDSKKMADKIHWIAKHPQTCRFKKNMGDYQKKYSVEIMASHYIKLLGIQNFDYSRSKRI